MEKYHSMNQISNQQQQIISRIGSHTEVGWEWKFSWRRTLFDNEVFMAADFLEESTRLTIQQNGEDSWIWKADSSGKYSTTTAYELLLEAARGETKDETFVELWKLKIPPENLQP